MIHQYQVTTQEREEGPEPGTIYGIPSLKIRYRGRVTVTATGYTCETLRRALIAEEGFPGDIRVNNRVRVRAA